MQKPTPSTPWQNVYQLPSLLDHQYMPMFTAAELAATKFRFVNELIDRSVPSAQYMIDQVELDFENFTDGQTSLAIDRLQSDPVRLRPLSYAYHLKATRALDVEQKDSGQSLTLRQMLVDEGKPAAPDSDIFAAKLGMSCLIAERRDGQITRVLTTHRSAQVAVFANAHHTSFSGGIDMCDMTQDDNAQTLYQLYANGAVRECAEELGVQFEPEQIDILGVWLGLDRLNAQAFGVVYVDDIAALNITPNDELTSYQIDPFDMLETIIKRDGVDQTPELRFMRTLLTPEKPLLLG